MGQYKNLINQTDTTESKLFDALRNWRQEPGTNRDTGLFILVHTMSLLEWAIIGRVFNDYSSIVGHIVNSICNGNYSYDDVYIPLVTLE